MALLRGVNVGRAKRLAMADWRALMAELGYRDVRTVLNSGNAVFDGPAKAPPSHARRIQRALAGELGLESRVIVKTADEVAAIAAGNPLTEVADNPSRLLVGFLEAPPPDELTELTKRSWHPEAVAVSAHAVYLWCPDGVIRSPLAKAVGERLGEGWTTRNASTVDKLAALAAAGGG